MVRRLVLAAAALAVVGLASCSTTVEKAALPPPTSPMPKPSPTPTFALTEVHGQRDVSVWSVSSDHILGRGDMTPPDDDAILAAVQTVGDWLDRHLDDLQRGGDGLLEEVAADGLLDGADPSVIAAATEDLAGGWEPVASARYELAVSHDGAPEWIEAIVHVTTQVDTTGDAVFVFAVDGDRPELVMFGPVEETA